MFRMLLIRGVHCSGTFQPIWHFYHSLIEHPIYGIVGTRRCTLFVHENHTMLRQCGFVYDVIVT